MKQLLCCCQESKQGLAVQENLPSLPPRASPGMKLVFDGFLTQEEASHMYDIYVIRTS